MSRNMGVKIPVKFAKEIEKTASGKIERKKDFFFFVFAIFVFQVVGVLSSVSCLFCFFVIFDVVVFGFLSFS